MPHAADACCLLSSTFRNSNSSQHSLNCHIHFKMQVDVVEGQRLQSELNWRLQILSTISAKYWLPRKNVSDTDRIIQLTVLIGPVNVPSETERRGKVCTKNGTSDKKRMHKWSTGEYPPSANSAVFCRWRNVPWWQKNWLKFYGFLYFILMALYSSGLANSSHKYQQPETLNFYPSFSQF